MCCADRAFACLAIFKVGRQVILRGRKIVDSIRCMSWIHLYAAFNLWQRTYLVREMELTVAAPAAPQRREAGWAKRTLCTERQVQKIVLAFRNQFVSCSLTNCRSRDV